MFVLPFSLPPSSISYSVFIQSGTVEQSARDSSTIQGWELILELLFRVHIQEPTLELLSRVYIQELALELLSRV